jgi:glutamate dehydrogenase
VAKALAIDATSMTPTELVNAILKAPVDLLYNGGIGTYVKAKARRTRRSATRQRRAAVNGSELRCKVVAEGGNLGCTQLGRDRVRAGGRQDLHRRDRQLGRCRHLRP